MRELSVFLKCFSIVKIKISAFIRENIFCFNGVNKKLVFLITSNFDLNSCHIIFWGTHLEWKGKDKNAFSLLYVQFYTFDYFLMILIIGNITPQIHRYISQEHCKTNTHFTFKWYLSTLPPHPHISKSHWFILMSKCFMSPILKRHTEDKKLHKQKMNGSWVCWVRTRKKLGKCRNHHFSLIYFSKVC